MRQAWLGGLLLLACVRTPGGASAGDEAGAIEVVAAPVNATAREVEPAAVAEPVPVPKLVLVDEDWVLDDEDPGGPLLRIVELRPSAPRAPRGTNGDDPAPIRALLGVLEPLLHCYAAELGRTPALTLTLTIRRIAPTDADRVGLSIEENTAEPTGIPACARPILAQALPHHAQDPHGRYALRLFPRRDQAPPLWLPELDDVVIEREGGSCFTRRTYPCKPHKICKAADWQRTRCRHPADRPGVALRWAFGVASPDGQWPREGVDLVGADDGLVWRTVLEPEDAEQLGFLHVSEAQRHLAEFRAEPLPGALLLALEPTRVVLADRAGVRVYERRTGKRGFRFAPADPEAPRMFLDEGTFTARKGKLRCTGDAGRGAFATVCGDDLLYFDGHALAVIDYGPPMSLRDQTTLRDDTSTRTGGAARPKASLRTAGWRVLVEGVVLLQ
jgi:hypothetical protein